MRWAGHVAHRVERRGTYRVLVSRPEGKRPIGRLICRWDLRERGQLEDLYADGI